MSADELRQAAATLREIAETAEPESGWSFYNGGERNDGMEPAGSGLIAWISLMSPDLGLALADWLDDEAKAAGYHENRVVPFAYTIARLINGGAA